MYSIRKHLLHEIKIQTSIKSKIVITIFRLAGLSKKSKVFYPFHVLNVLINEILLSVEIPSGTKIGQSMRIYHAHSIIVHGDFIIGNNLVIRQNTTIGSSSGRTELTSRIGNNVNIGAGSIIIGDDISIEDNVVIGAGVVVNKSIPKGAVVVGYGFKIINKSE